VGHVNHTIFFREMPVMQDHFDVVLPMELGFDPTTDNSVLVFLHDRKVGGHNLKGDLFMNAFRRHPLKLQKLKKRLEIEMSSILEPWGRLRVKKMPSYMSFLFFWAGFFYCFVTRNFFQKFVADLILDSKKFGHRKFGNYGQKFVNAKIGLKTEKSTPNSLKSSFKSPNSFQFLLQIIF